MNVFKYFAFLFSLSVFSQNTISIVQHTKTPLQADALIEIDNFNTSYFLRNNTLIKINESENYSYSNVQLNEITSANVFNPLKINVFYKAFNSALILDNRLAEILKIDFNLIKPFRAVTHISTGNDNTIWIYNENTLQIELFDYKSNKSRIVTLPNEGDILDLESNFNFCWLLTTEYIYVYNYAGSLIDKYPNEEYTNIEEKNGNLFLLKDDQLLFKPKNSSKIEALEIPKLLINQFLVTNETLYIYTDEMLHKFQLKIN